MDALLISNDFYLAQGLQSCIAELRWLWGEETLGYFLDRSQKPYLVIIDARTPGLAYLQLPTGGESTTA